MTNLIPWKRTEGQRNGGLAPISQMRWGWERMFDQLLDDVWGPVVSATRGMPLDIAETDEHIRVRAEVPGISPDELNISLSGEVLTLTGQKLDEDESQESSRYHCERSFGSYQRMVKLPCAVDPDHVQAEHRNGVVTITLQKAAAVRPKRIKVKSA